MSDSLDLAGVIGTWAAVLFAIIALAGVLPAYILFRASRQHRSQALSSIDDPRHEFLSRGIPFGKSRLFRTVRVPDFTQLPNLEELDAHPQLDNLGSRLSKTDWINFVHVLTATFPSTKATTYKNSLPLRTHAAYLPIQRTWIIVLGVLHRYAIREDFGLPRSVEPVISYGLHQNATWLSGISGLICSTKTRDNYIYFETHPLLLLRESLTTNAIPIRTLVLLFLGYIEMPNGECFAVIESSTRRIQSLQVSGRYGDDSNEECQYAENLDGEIPDQEIVSRPGVERRESLTDAESFDLSSSVLADSRPDSPWSEPESLSSHCSWMDRPRSIISQDKRDYRILVAKVNKSEQNGDDEKILESLNITISLNYIMMVNPIEAFDPPEHFKTDGDTSMVEIANMIRHDVPVYILVKTMEEKGCYSIGMWGVEGENYYIWMMKAELHCILFWYLDVKFSPIGFLYPKSNNIVLKRVLKTRGLRKTLRSAKRCVSKLFVSRKKSARLCLTLDAVTKSCLTDISWSRTRMHDLYNLDQAITSSCGTDNWMSRALSILYAYNTEFRIRLIKSIEQIEDSQHRKITFDVQNKLIKIADWEQLSKTRNYLFDFEHTFANTRLLGDIGDSEMGFAQAAIASLQGHIRAIMWKMTLDSNGLKSFHDKLAPISLVSPHSAEHMKKREDLDLESNLDL
jgi:hypothetical protein